MAVATEREYGLFINGESTDPASGEKTVRERKSGDVIWHLSLIHI